MTAGIEEEKAAPPLEPSPIRWGRPYEELTSDEKAGAWFTDGWSRWVSGRQRWKAAALRPSDDAQLIQEGEGGSSQLAELVAVTLPSSLPTKEIRIYTDSRAVANGMAIWMVSWQMHQWTVHNKPIWGKEYWQQIWQEVRRRDIYVYPVNAHQEDISPTTLYNS
ncbi:ribonuclease H-like [Mobula hypostoma]|uniref:ribonuclease H-like n=1 Tax=Mobula hypostoma TaxID=723540 RepID=UPI002FC28919